MKNLLVAIRPDDVELMRSALAADFGLSFCHSLAAARAGLAAPVDAVICGLHFDDGNMFELLRQLRFQSDTRRLPFFCVKGAGNALSPAILKSILIATEKMGADGFADLPNLQRQYGDELAFEILRDAVHRMFDMPAGSSQIG
jgi:hypothetical protein